jgi:hypothetical protein
MVVPLRLAPAAGITTNKQITIRSKQRRMGFYLLGSEVIAGLGEISDLCRYKSKIRHSLHPKTSQESKPCREVSGQDGPLNPDSFSWKIKLLEAPRLRLAPLPAGGGPASYELFLAAL